MRKTPSLRPSWALLGIVAILCLIGLRLSLPAPSGLVGLGRLQPGEAKALPELHFTDQDGKAVSLQDFKGKLVVLDVWATWCAPCRAEFPQLDRLQTALGDQGLVVLALSVDLGGRKAVDQFYEQIKVKSLGKYLDPTGESANLLKLRGLPTALVLNREGQEIARVEGERAWDGTEMKAALQKLLNDG